MYIITICYLLYILAFTFLHYEIDSNDSRYDINNAVKSIGFIIPLLSYNLDTFKKLAFFTFFNIFNIIYYYIWTKSNVTIILVQIQHFCIFEILRYAFFYQYHIQYTRSIKSAKKHFGFFGIISNLAFVIQTRLPDGLERVNFKYAQYFTIPLIVISSLLFGLIFKQPPTNELYNDDITYKRTHNQSLLTFTGTLSTLTTLKYIKDYSDLNPFYETIPAVITIILVSINENIFSLHYRIYSLIPPISFMLCSGILAFYPYSFADYVINGFYFFITTFHYILFDPTRFILYISHSQSVSSFYIGYDLIYIGLAYILSEYLHSIYKYAIIPLHALWLLLAYISKKYYLRDNATFDCIELTRM
jgi:hypothetical protein